MTPNLLLCPDTQSQLPVISVSVIRAILGKIEPALKHGNTTPALSLVDLSKSSEAFELSGRSEARRIPALSSRALEGPILAGGGARGRMPWIPVARELLHGGVPHPPTPSHPSPALPLGCWPPSESKHCYISEKEPSEFCHHHHHHDKAPTNKLSRIETRQHRYSCQLKSIQLLPSNASKHRHAHSNQSESLAQSTMIGVLRILAVYAHGLIWEIGLLAQSSLGSERPRVCWALLEPSRACWSLPKPTLV